RHLHAYAAGLWEPLEPILGWRIHDDYRNSRPGSAESDQRTCPRLPVSAFAESEPEPGQQHRRDDDSVPATDHLGRDKAQRQFLRTLSQASLWYAADDLEQ